MRCAAAGSGGRVENTTSVGDVTAPKTPGPAPVGGRRSGRLHSLARTRRCRFPQVAGPKTSGPRAPTSMLPPAKRPTRKEMVPEDPDDAAPEELEDLEEV